MCGRTEWLEHKAINRIGAQLERAEKLSQIALADLAGLAGLTGPGRRGLGRRLADLARPLLAGLATLPRTLLGLGLAGLVSAPLLVLAVGFHGSEYRADQGVWIGRRRDFTCCRTADAGRFRTTEDQAAFVCQIRHSRA